MANFDVSVRPELDCIEDDPDPASASLSQDISWHRAQTFRQRIALLGVSIDNLTMNEVVERIDCLIDEGGCHQVATANVDFLTKAFHDGELLNILHHCELVVPDGMPLVWASRMLGVPFRERVTGADLVPRLLDLSARKKRRIFLLGATEQSSRAAVTRIEKDYPGAIICGRHSPPFRSEEWVEEEMILQLIAEAKPDLLLVAFGNPKQEKWIAKNRDRLRVPVCIGVGAAIDFLSGHHSRAPLWMQSHGLEWMHRLFNEPRRLAARYLKNGIFLLRYLSVQIAVSSLQSRATRESRVSVAFHGSILTAGIVGGFCGAVAQKLFEQLQNESYEGSFVLDLTATEFISPDAAGMLIYLAQQCTRTGDELWIAGPAPGLRAVLQATFPAGEPFRMSTTFEEALCSAGSSSPPATRLKKLASAAA